MQLQQGLDRGSSHDLQDAVAAKLEITPASGQQDLHHPGILK